MPHSRMERIMVAALIAILIVVYFDYERRLYREAPARFYIAAISGDTEDMASVLDHHLVRLNQPSWGGYRFIRTLREEALVGAASVSADRVASVRFLLDRGMSVNTRAEDGASILTEAVMRQNPECAKLLIEHGANLHQDDHSRLGTPLMVAAQDAYFTPETVEVARLLLAKGVDVNGENEYGSTPLLRACGSDNTDLVRELLAHGARVNAQDHYGQTALTRATDGGYVEIVRILVAHGAEVSRGKGRIGSALHTARTWNATEIVRLLTQATAKRDPRSIRLR